MDEPGISGGFKRCLSQVSIMLAKAASSSEPAWLEEMFKYRQSRYASRRTRRRIVFKHGDCNIVQGNVAKRRRRYLQDLFTTLVDAQWRWTLLVFAMSFLLSWLVFGALWWLIALAHGDVPDEEPVAEALALDSSKGGNETAAPIPAQAQAQAATMATPCVTGVDSFASGFLFSVETQHTIGYGVRAPTVECPEAIFIMCLQSIVGVFIQAFMVGIVFAKLSRPKKRTTTLLFSDRAVVCERDRRLQLLFRVADLRKSHIVEAHVRAQLIRRKVGLIFAKLARAKKRTTTLLFSRNAVVCLRDGLFCLLFRVGDIRKSHILEAHVRAQIIRKKVTKEGELLPFYQQELKVGPDGEEDRLMFIWPTTVAHIINEDSPLYNLSASDMLRERFEIVVMLEGVIESTGMTTQARSSYLPSEIFWGHRFEPVVSFRKETGEYEVDYTLFNNTYEVDTPLCSAKQLDELRASVNSSNRTAMAHSIPALGCAPSRDTLDSCSVDSMSLDEHIEIKMPGGGGGGSNDGSKSSPTADCKDNRRLLESQSDVSNPHHHPHHHQLPLNNGSNTTTNNNSDLGGEENNTTATTMTITSEKPPPPIANGVNHHLHHGNHHHHHHHPHLNGNGKHHHGQLTRTPHNFSDHSLYYTGLNGGPPHLNNNDEKKLPRSFSGQLINKTMLEVPDSPPIRIPIPVLRPETSPPHDLV